MTVATDVFWIIGSYIVIIILIYVIFNFVTKGFISQYLKVKISRGKLILVKCYDVTDTFYKAGKVDSKRSLIVKDRNRKIHTFGNVNKDYLQRELGTNLMEVDLVKGIIIKRDFSEATAYDLTLTDDMVNRALMLPKLKNDEVWEKLQKFLWIIVIIGIGVIIYLLVTLKPVCNCVTPVTGVNI